MPASTLDQYLLLHKHAPLAWMAWLFLTFLTIVASIVAGPLVGIIPIVQEPVIPVAMITIAMVWAFAGSSAGWLPRRM